MVTLQPKRVLVPTDFSDQANQAVDEAFAMVDDPGHLTVLHVAPALSSFSEGDPLVGWNMVSDEERHQTSLGYASQELFRPEIQEGAFPSQIWHACRRDR